ncbi:DJ-1/PfpI family protein [Tsukamurella sp. 8F]|uniref:DJ-1/PfpI family protein n=1 Tax=unclassified Tsukamurella TaxID=2633480 RepID=UPI0023B8AE32|nr:MULTISPECIES: DJ-1/PfpI family protein [unclassified Tsukamurella]MDF0530463.1 DJ-1/PfpI family protein [Tsukamurella sp. 8J]MDF0587716.1 DJ-1/PfpI family protein [Tsukamurella sp. 8F]
MQIAIVLYPRFTALDFIGPYEVLRALPDAQVRFVAHAPGPVANDAGGLLVGATHGFDETPEPDIVLVPGGPGCVAATRDEELLAWLRAAHTHATWTTSVCTGSVILAAAGLLEGRSATSHWSGLPALRTFGVAPVPDRRIVHEGDVVTAAGVSAGIDLGLWLAARIGGDEFAQAIQLVLEYDPQPPFDTGHMSKASAATKARATALLSRDLADVESLRDGALFAWDRAIAAIRGLRPGLTTRLRRAI